MARRYSPAELMQLRGSPLVCKPAGLPDIEQWMEYVRSFPRENIADTLCRPQPGQNQRKPAINRAKIEDPLSYTEIAGPRPSLYETRHMSRGSATGLSRLRCMRGFVLTSGYFTQFQVRSFLGRRRLHLRLHRPAETQKRSTLHSVPTSAL